MRSGHMLGLAALAMLLLAAGGDCLAHASLQHLKGVGSVVPDAAQGLAPEQRHPLLLQRDAAVHFQVIGDWGRQGQWNQSELADVMAAAARDLSPAFVVSVGDNFYPSGLTSVDDDNFAQSFIDVYHQPELQVPWYAVAGNHDYGDGIAPGDPPLVCPPDEPAWRCSAGPLTQLSADLRRRDERWQCRRSRVLSLSGGALDVFMYDTTPFVQYYYDRSWAANPGGIREQSWMANLAELEAELAASEASWKLVVGHHPVRSNGFEHGDTPELRRWVEPLLEKYGVQLYLAGHDHDLEHIKEPGKATHHVVSGAGSQTREMGGSADALFQHDGQGFVSVSVRRDALQMTFFGLDGPQPLYTAVIPRGAAADEPVAPDETAPHAAWASATGEAVEAEAELTEAELAEAELAEAESPLAAGEAVEAEAEADATATSVWPDAAEASAAVGGAAAAAADAGGETEPERNAEFLLRGAGSRASGFDAGWDGSWESEAAASVIL